MERVPRPRPPPPQRSPLRPGWQRGRGSERAPRARRGTGFPPRRPSRSLVSRDGGTRPRAAIPLGSPFAAHLYLLWRGRQRRRREQLLQAYRARGDGPRLACFPPSPGPPPPPLLHPCPMTPARVARCLDSGASALVRYRARGSIPDRPPPQPPHPRPRASREPRVTWSDRPLPRTPPRACASRAPRATPKVPPPGVPAPGALARLDRKARGATPRARDRDRPGQTGRRHRRGRQIQIIDTNAEGGRARGTLLPRSARPTPSLVPK